MQREDDIMPTKSLQPASWSAQEVPSTRTGSAQPNPTPDEAGQIRKLMPESSTSGGCGSPGKPSAFEEIYRSAGIKGARMGYSISKVIEMLENEHIRKLPGEMKRGALLMALEAAGVHVHEVLLDAMLRQSALNSYEANKRKQQEQYEARKGEENCAMQAELNHLTAQYLARIKANLDEVGREQDAFRKWQTEKQQEAQRIAEAVAVCADPKGATEHKDSVHALRELVSVGEPGFGARG
jgi:hypothetical protein